MDKVRNVFRKICGTSAFVCHVGFCSEGLGDEIADRRPEEAMLVRAASPTPVDFRTL